MSFKIIVFAATLIAVNAQHYEHGHATSSQSIIRHDNSHNQHGYHHEPVAVHVAPVHHAPVHHAPVHHAPIVHAPVHYNQHGYGHGHEHEDYYDHPHYEFQYNVEDTHTGDIKSHHEAREGDHVTGSYSLHQPDGSVRTVHYNVEGHSGFQAQVEHSAPSTHVQPAPVHHQPVHYAPVHHVPIHHAPVHHAPVHHAPVHHIPVQHVAVHHEPVHHVAVHHEPVHHAPVHHEPVHYAPVHHAPIVHYAPTHHVLEQHH